MDGFGDDFGQTDVDPAAEFLAREQDQLAGLEDELDPISAPTENNGMYELNAYKIICNTKEIIIFLYFFSCSSRLVMRP